MNNISLNNIELLKWISDKGDYTHNLEYDLDEKSSIMDFGGYNGIWAQQMIDKYSPNVFILEPVPKFYNFMIEKFKKNPKVQLLNVAVGTENKEDKFFLNEDASSSNIKNGQQIDIKFITIQEVFKIFQIQQIDLLQINIEGDEYSLLESMIENKYINKFKNIQIQFHLGVENCIDRRENIHKNLLKNNFKNKFNYPFVWESWTKQ